MAFEFIQQALTERKQNGLYRQHHVVIENHDAMLNVDGKPYLNFASNDYLGLSQHPAVLQTWVEGLAKYGAGSGASPLVTGFSLAHQQLTDSIAALVGRDNVLLFSSGFAANQAICQALFNKGGELYADKLSHASLIDGGLHSKAAMKRFKHNDLNHLQQLLCKGDASINERLIVSEGIFSMDGDCGDVTALAGIAEQHNCWLMIDDAHGFGVFGEQRQGVAASKANQQQCQVLMATLGKACGIGGAFVAGSEELIEFLQNYARHYIYSTAMPPAQAHAAIAAIELIKQGVGHAALHTNIQYFKQRISSEGFDLLDSNSAIQPLVIGKPKTVMAMAGKLKQLGVWVGAMRYPTVPKQTDRLRVTLSAAHQSTDIDALVDALCVARESL